MVIALACLKERLEIFYVPLVPLFAVGAMVAVDFIEQATADLLALRVIPLEAIFAHQHSRALQILVLTAIDRIVPVLLADDAKSTATHWKIEATGSVVLLDATLKGKGIANAVISGIERRYIDLRLQVLLVEAVVLEHRNE